jgi:hypothetical protein
MINVADEPTVLNDLAERIILTACITRTLT